MELKELIHPLEVLEVVGNTDNSVRTGTDKR